MIHDILLEKLDHYGIRDILSDCFRSYLSDRSEFVSINGFNSDYKNIKYGVPQDSVLGPLLFLIFINDINTAIKHSETFYFADNTCLSNIKDSVKEINRVVNKDLKFLVQFINANRISLNVAKSEIAIFRRKKKHLDCDLNLKLCEKNKLKQSNYIRYFDIHMDEYVNWSPHINHLSEKLVKSNAMLGKLCQWSSYQINLLCYFSFPSFICLYCIGSEFQL